MRLYNKDKWLDIISDKKYQLIRQNITDSFQDLVFQEKGHKYFVKGRELISVSNLIHKFQEHFDEKSVAQRTYKSHFNNPDSKYYQMSVEQIIESWHTISRNACEHGTDRHNFGESCFYFMIGDYSHIVGEFADRMHIDENGDFYFESIYPKEDAIVKFWTDIPRCMIPVLAENKVYSIQEEYAYSGTFDLLFYYDSTLNNQPEENSGLVIFDYKTNKDLYKNFDSNRLLEPFNDLLDMPLNIYKLQLSAYQHCLENIGLKIIGRRLIWIKPDGTYIKINLESYVQKLVNELKKHDG